MTGGSVSATGRGGQGAVTWRVATETPIAFEYNRQAHAVMMATPADLEDFAIGFALAEEIIATVDDIESLTLRPAPQGVVADMRVDPARLLRGALRQRNMTGRSGCGLCGVDSLANAIRPPRPVRGIRLDPAAAARALADLPDHQPLNRLNRSVHAAAWADLTGRIHLAREDVGRHNALDKLIGALARGGFDPAGGFVVVSSRCSFELVQKAAAVGIGGLVCQSAPTALALTLAAQAGVALAAADGDGGVVLFEETAAD